MTNSTQKLRHCPELHGTHLGSLTRKTFFFCFKLSQKGEVETSNFILSCLSDDWNRVLMVTKLETGLCSEEQEEMAPSCSRGGLGWISVGTSSLEGFSNPGAGCPGEVVEAPSLEGFES